MPCVLIVDDSHGYLDALSLALKDLNPDWEIITAVSASDGKSILQKKKIDLVLTDLVMPSSEGGMELLRFAKDKDPLIMTILYTGHGDRLDRNKAYELGAFDCVDRTTVGIKMNVEMNFKARSALRFRKIAQELIRGQQRIEFLKRYFDPHVFGRIEKDRSLLNLQDRMATICFWDIRGFSRLCEILKAEPSLIAGFLKEYFQIGSETIFSLDGILDKFIGDGIMALFGVFSDTDDEGCKAAENAVTCALNIRHKFDVLQKKWSEKWARNEAQLIDIGIGCGIHTGVRTLVGNVGTDLRDQYTALGPNVNFAARLERLAEKGQILISSTCESRIRGKFLLNKIKTVNDVKNMPGEFTIHEIIR